MLAVLGVAAGSGAAIAASPAEFTVDSDGPAKFWTGDVPQSGATIPTVPECAASSCDHAKIKVKLPNQIWQRPGGLEISIRWQGGFTDILGLYVYRDTTRVAASEAGVGLAQSVLIPSAMNGTYQVYVRYMPGGESASLHYEGLSEVEYRPAANPPRDLLPDLQARPQEHVTFDRPLFDFFEPAPPPGQNCFDSERVELGAVLCLRFDQIMANVGEGPLDVRFSRPAGVQQDEPATQRIYQSVGGYREISAGTFVWHAVHHHYHFTGFAQSVLWHADGAGNRVGTTPASTGRKVSFCIADTDLDAWGVKGNGPTSYPAPNCLDPDSSSGGTEYFKQGMTNGFADRYTWDLPAQYVEASGLSNGLYRLETTVNPEHILLEASYTNNCVVILVQLSGMGTSTPQAQIVPNNFGLVC
jgi:Lysyl oxidase